MNQEHLELGADLGWPVEVPELAEGRPAHRRQEPPLQGRAEDEADRVVWRYILDTNARFNALKAGRGSAMESQAQPQIKNFMSDKDFKVDARIGFSHEHIDIQFGARRAIRP